MQLFRRKTPLLIRFWFISTLVIKKYTFSLSKLDIDLSHSASRSRVPAFDWVVDAPHELLPPLPPQSNQECSFFAHFYPCISQPHLDSIILPNNTLHESRQEATRAVSCMAASNKLLPWLAHVCEVATDSTYPQTIAMAFEESKRSDMSHDSTSSSVRCILLMQGAIVMVASEGEILVLSLTLLTS